MKVLKQCPQCGKIYSGPSALSRSDNSTEICPACGMAEALKAMDAVKADAARDQGAEINVSGYESSDSPDPFADASIGGKNHTKTVIDLSSGSKAEKIDKLCGLINMILKPADPVVKHGALIAVQTMLCEKHEDSIEPVLQEFTDTMNQYFDEYRSYLTDEQRQLILSAFE